VNTRTEKQLPEDMKIWRVDHLPVVGSYCKKLGLVEMVNNLVDSQMKVSPGIIVQGMVLDTLSGRSPLYRLEEFFELQDMELLLGEELEAHDFNDTTVGRTLDKIYEAGTMKIFSEVTRRAVRLFSVKMQYLHYDTTSVSVWGDYDLYHEGQDSEMLRITHGHSKDNRPDLKQFLLQALCVEHNIPIMGGTEDGNSSDKTNNNKVLKNVSGWMAKHGLAPGAFIYVADSAMVTEDNIKSAGENLFITRLPFNYSECAQVVTEAVERGEWDEVGVIARTKPTRNRPVSSYRVAEGEVFLYGQTYRAIVVHSTAHDKRRQKRIDRELKQSRDQLEKKAKGVEEVEYYCFADAESAARRVEKQGNAFYEIETEVVERPKYARGRPSRNKERKINEMRYGVKATIKEKTDAVSRKRQEAGCFVLLTNVPKQGENAHSPKEILRTYKDQHGVERNFGFLKDPLIVNDIFLKNPERIEVLGMILLISLLVWTLMERSMRQFVAEAGTTLPGWVRRQTDRPTSFMMTTKLKGIMVVKSAKERFFARKLSPVQEIYLQALGITPEVFLSPKLE